LERGAVNYAALLAVLLVLGLAFPVLVRLANANGVPQSVSIVAAVLGAVFVLAWFLIRQRVARYRQIGERVAQIKTRLEQNPDNPEAYFDQNEHLGDLLIAINRRREALGVFERYIALEKASGKDLPKLEARLEKLRTHLDELN
jgi:predicted nuclease with TOPRIM domain